MLADRMQRLLSWGRSKRASRNVIAGPCKATGPLSNHFLAVSIMTRGRH